MMSAAFQKRVEDFVCAHCGLQVQGTGYTNHCPRCLWSKHVDIHPGDRAAECGGMMEPLRLEGSTPRYRIVHRCTVCGFERVNDVETNDESEAILRLAKGRGTING